jgi:CheY-like chemotaxis protein
LFPATGRIGRRLEGLLDHQSGRLLNLLLVEDNPADVLLLESAFEEVGLNCRMQVTSDGERAITYLLSHAPREGDRPDLILLDLNLPRMNGHQVLKFIKSDLVMQSIPVVVLSSSAAPYDVASAYRQGASSYLLKPTDVEETFEMVRAIGQYWMKLAVLPAFSRS